MVSHVLSLSLQTIGVKMFEYLDYDDTYVSI